MKQYFGNLWALAVHLGREFLMWIDAGANGIFLTLAALFMAAVTGKAQDPAYVDETLSSHCWRAAQAGKRPALFFLPIIDFLFSWQKPDPTITYPNGEPVTGHCYRAFLKEQGRRYLPPAYREATKGPLQ